MASQSQHKEPYYRFEIYGAGDEHNYISSCTKAKQWMFENVYIKGYQMKLFL